MSPVFDTHVIVDWSARSRPSPARETRDAIWWACVRHGGVPDTNYARTRAEALGRLGDLLSAEVGAGRRVLAGFDFPFGYPEGVAARLTGRPCARAIWDWLAERIEDGPDNTNNRFAVAEAINRCYDGAGPCWGRPADWPHSDLPVTANGRHGSDHPPERRRADARARGAKTVWQTAYAGSVGSQVLLGLPALRRLAGDARLTGQVAIWPFDGSLRLPDAPVVIAEVYPSLLAEAVAARWDKKNKEVRDRAQVRVIAAAFAALDCESGLAPLFAGPEDLPDDDRAVIEREEAWILGLGAERRLSAALDRREARRGALPLAGVLPSPAGTRREARVIPAAARPPVELREGAEALDTTQASTRTLRYIRDPAEIYRLSFEAVRAEARLDHLPADLQDVAVRLVHACGMPEITARLAWSPGVAGAARAALAGGATVLCDCRAVAAMVIRERLPAGNDVVCTLGHDGVAERARRLGTTRSAAAVELWADRVGGAVVAIGNAPTALYRLLELMDDGWPRPAAVLAFPVGFVGAAESKAELAARPRGMEFLTLRGRRGGSAMAAAAVNALARAEP